MNKIVIAILLLPLILACSQDPTYRNSIDMDFVLIPAGSFQMGSDNGEPDEQPVHTVEISQPFYMGIHEVTQAQWEQVMGITLSMQQQMREKQIPLNGIGPDYPMYFINWDDAVAFTKRLNTMEGSDLYRLPTEAEWEYACRAGTTGDFNGDLDQAAWYGANADGTAHPVGQKQPNAWGLFDMHGNVWEWCRDWLDRDYYKQGNMTDPTGGPPGERRMIRGGGWFNEANFLRSAHRNYTSPGAGGPHLGFRVVRMADED